MTLTIALYSASNTRKNSAKISATSVSAATTLFGGVISGCGCQAAILFNVLAVGVGSGEATLINTIVSENAPIVFLALIALNLSVIVYYLQKLSKPACRIKNEQVLVCMAYKKGKKSLKRKAVKGGKAPARPAKRPTYLSYGLRQSSSYEEVLLNGIISKANPNKIPECALIFNSVLSSLTPAMRSLYYKSGTDREASLPDLPAR